MATCKWHLLFRQLSLQVVKGFNDLAYSAVWILPAETSYILCAWAWFCVWQRSVPVVLLLIRLPSGLVQTRKFAEQLNQILGEDVSFENLPCPPPPYFTIQPSLLLYPDSYKSLEPTRSSRSIAFQKQNGSINKYLNYSPLTHYLLTCSYNK